MEVGISRLAEYMLKKGFIQGAIGGLASGITLSVVIVAVIRLFKENKKLKEEEKVILKELEDGLGNMASCEIDKSAHDTVMSDKVNKSEECNDEK